MLENLDRRIMGALRFIDAVTGARILTPVSVRGAGVQFIRNLSGYYAIAGAPGLENHATAFQNAPNEPNLESVAIEITVEDPLGDYVGRTQTIRLPRDPAPANVAQSNSLFRPIDVRLFRSPAARVEPNWAVIRARVTDRQSGRPLGGALVRVLRASDSGVMARGLSDVRGEALVPVPGIPITTFAEGGEAVTTTTVAVNVEAIFDQNLRGVPNPDDIEARRDSLRRATSNQNLASGRSVTVTLSP